MSPKPDIPRARRADIIRAQVAAFDNKPCDGVWADPTRTTRQLALDWLLAFGLSIALWSLIALLGWAAYAAIKAVLS